MKVGTEGLVRHGVFTPSHIVRLSSGERRSFAMNATEIRDCLRDLQVIATQPRISEEQITELLKKKLIQRAEKADGIWLTQLGVYTKSGEA
jgi:hypothetical protein